MKKLTKEQIEIIKLRYPDEGASVLAKEFDINPGTIHACARRNNLSMKDRFWEQEKLKILKENYYLGAKEVATILNMPVNKVVAMATRLKLGKKREQWTKEKIEILKNRYKKDGPKIIAKDLGLTKGAVIAKAKRLGLTKTLKRWTEEEDKILIEKFPTHKAVDLRRELGKSEFGILKRAEHLGIYKTKKLYEVKDKWKEIGDNYIAGKPIRVLSQDFNISKATIMSILKKLNINSRDYDIKRFPKKENPRKSEWVGDLSSTRFKSIKKTANNRCLDFDLTMEYLWDLFLKQNKKCAISGIKIEFANTQNKASLDRIDSSRGYIIGNVQWVQKDINFMKGSLAMDDFLALCKKIINYNKKNIKKEIV